MEKIYNVDLLSGGVNCTFDLINKDNSMNPDSTTSDDSGKFKTSFQLSKLFDLIQNEETNKELSRSLFNQNNVLNATQNFGVVDANSNDQTNENLFNNVTSCTCSKKRKLLAINENGKELNVIESKRNSLVLTNPTCANSDRRLSLNLVQNLRPFIMKNISFNLLDKSSYSLPNPDHSNQFRISWATCDSFNSNLNQFGLGVSSISYNSSFYGDFVMGKGQHILTISNSIESILQENVDNDEKKSLVPVAETSELKFNVKCLVKHLKKKAIKRYKKKTRRGF